MDFKIEMRNSLIDEINSLADSEKDIVFERFTENERFKVYEIIVKVAALDKFRVFKSSYFLPTEEFDIDIISLDKDILNVIRNV